MLRIKKVSLKRINVFPLILQYFPSKIVCKFIDFISLGSGTCSQYVHFISGKQMVPEKVQALVQDSQIVVIFNVLSLF